MDSSVKSQVSESTRDASSSSRVMLIGQDCQFESSLEQALTGLGYPVTYACGSADALRKLRENPYAVVLTNPETSVHEGLALADEIHHIRPAVRVIILAPDSTSEDILAALRQRVFLCLRAPFEPGSISRYVDSAIKDHDPVGIDVISSQPNWITVRMDGSPLNAGRLIAFFDQLRLTLPEPPPEELMIAFREILQNAIEHGTQNDPSKLIHVSAIHTNRALVFHISDPGHGFRRDVSHAAIGNAPDQLTHHIKVREQLGMRPGGYGILSARGYVDQLIYNEAGNEVLLIKYLPPADTPQPD
jgi:anti-sigma regulatory factor (Ser/Thr protein kinase)/ActR/RegA family two-component response regulator